MHLRHLSIAALLLAFGMTDIAAADTLSMPPADSAATRQPVQIEMPARGMTKKQVEAKFGAPAQKVPAVGKPPISRWIYPDYTVYFEYQYVIEAVLRRK